MIMTNSLVKTVTFGVIAFNEHNDLPNLLSDLIEQDYPSDCIEVILVDGISDDDTKNIMMSFMDNNIEKYRAIKVLDNPKRIQPAGWNIVINNSSSDIILRVDAHARVPADFISSNVNCINRGESVCGGPRENIIDENTPWKRMLLDAEMSLFGSGIAPYRNETDSIKYVKSVFHGAYRREVFEKVGLFNENLIRTEDNELHYRIIRNGYRICYDPTIKSYYQTRNTLKKMIVQKYNNGFWIGKTLKVCPGCISIFHLVPFVFVLMLVISIIIYPVFKLLFVAIVVSYSAFIVVNMGVNLYRNKNLCDLLLPLVFFMMHVSYGIGTFLGLISGGINER